MWIRIEQVLLEIIDSLSITRSPFVGERLPCRGAFDIRSGVYNGLLISIKIAPYIVDISLARLMIHLSPVYWPIIDLFAPESLTIGLNISVDVLDA